MITCVYQEHFVHGTLSKLMQNKDAGDTALIQACQCGQVGTARVLLDHGANVDYQNKARKHLNSTLT